MGDDSRIWIGGLPEDVNEDDIKQEYDRFGEIKHIQIRNNKGAGNVPSKLFAFVQYRDARDAADAVRGTDQQKLFGQPFVKVSWADSGGAKGKSKGRSRSRRRSPSPRNRRSPSPRNRSRDREPPRDRYAEDRRDDGRDERPRSRSARRASPPRRSRERSPPRGDNRERRNSSPPRSYGGSQRESHYGPKPSELQGKFRVKIEKLPEDMGWQELKALGTGFAKSGTCTFSRTMRDQTGILEFTTPEDMNRAIDELDGRRFVDSNTKCKAYEDKPPLNRNR